jgi:8-amino-7-oxononanoate synthase
VPRATTPALAHLAAALHTLDEQGLLRRRPEPWTGARPTFCSNDYLGLASAGRAANRRDREVESGAGASRLVAGERSAHAELETAIARWLGSEGALAFTSGYAANVGLIGALVSPSDLIVSDALNHASIVDGCRLAKAEVCVVPHLDQKAVEQALSRPRRGRAWVVTETYFSMDGDQPDLARLRAACDEHGAGLLVDEAHALGVLGPAGRGLCAQTGVAPDAMTGTLGKAFGHQGAFVAGSEALMEWLWNRARSFVFSTGLSPLVADGARSALEEAARNPTLRERCLANAERLREGLRASGHAWALRGSGPIVPLIVGAPERAVRMATFAQEHGIHVQAIRPPTVPVGTSRLRVTVTARHTSEDIAAAVTVLGDALLRFT